MSAVVLTILWWFVIAPIAGMHRNEVEKEERKRLGLKDDDKLIY